MKCPFCNYEETKVIDSRAVEENNSIRRRRQCEKCEKRFTTYEKVDIIPLAIIKRDGTRETFDRDKLYNGILRSCNKRPISIKTIDKLVDDIENKILNSMEKEIASAKIGEMVMEKLKEVDEVAYVRFASVYKHFKDIDTFIDELGKLLQEKKGGNDSVN
jgi:transcriptional repressor NrdR